VKRVSLLSVFLFVNSYLLFSQTSDLKPETSFFTPSPTLNKQRVHLVTYSAIGLYPLTMSWFYAQWYSDYSKPKFHLFNDEAEWQQMDK